MAVSSKSLSGLRGDLKLSSASEARPALHLRLSPEALVAIRQGKGKLTFTDGLHPVFRVGDTEYKLSSTPESSPPEVYTHNRRTNTLELSGRLERRLLPDRTLNDTDVQERLKERNEQVLQAKESQRIVSLDAASIHKAKDHSLQRSSSSSPAPGKRVASSTASGSKPRQPTRLVADHIPQRSQSAQGFHNNDSQQYNYNIHAQKAHDKVPPPAASAHVPTSAAPQDHHAASVSDASSTSSYGDAASLFSSRVSTSSNTSVSSADSPPAKPEVSATSLTVNPAMLMRAPTQHAHPLPQKPQASQPVVAQPSASPPSLPSKPEPVKSQPAKSTGGVLKGKETAKKEKKKADSKVKSAETIEDDDDSDFQIAPTSKSGKRKAPAASSSTSKSNTNKKPKSLPAKAAVMERSGSNSSTTSRESISNKAAAPKTESRTAGGARVCGKPAKKTAPTVTSSPAHPSRQPSPQPGGSGKKRKAPASITAANKKSKRDFEFTSSEDEDAEGEDDDDEEEDTPVARSAPLPAVDDRGRADGVKRTHLSQSSAAASVSKPSAPSQATTPGISRANSFERPRPDHSVSDPIRNDKQYAQARAEFVKVFEDFEQRRKKMKTKQDILRRLLAGKDLADEERILIPSKREVTNMVTEVNEMSTQLNTLKTRLWAYARDSKQQ